MAAEAACDLPSFAERIGQAAEEVFLVEVEPFVAERLPALAGQAADEEARRRAGALVEELLRMSPEERLRTSRSRKRIAPGQSASAQHS